MQGAIYRKLTEVVERYSRERRPKRADWVKKLFEALNWRGEVFSIADDQDGYRLLVDDLPVVNILVEPPTEVERVYTALNRAYNQDVAWVIATDFKSLGLFGSYWISSPNDVTGALGFKAGVTDYLIDSHNLDYLTPEEVSRSRLNELYAAYTTRRRKIPIDLHLIDQMSLALEACHAPAVEADELIHKLINDLFLVRYLEDTGLLPLNERLSEIALTSSNAGFLAGLEKTFLSVKRRTGYSVLESAQLDALDGAPLRMLVQNLYGYPEWGIRYDFAAMSVDIMGRFYEKYLHLKAATHDFAVNTPSPHELSLFPPPSHELQDVRKEQGVYYTPRYMVDYILSKLIDRFDAVSSKPGKQLPTILDLSVGSGTFLSAAISHLQEDYRGAGVTLDSIVQHLIGLDNDYRAIEASRLNLTARLLTDDFQGLLPHLKLKAYDLLSGGPSSPELKSFLPAEGIDIIVGNPPYIPYETLLQRYDLEKLQANFVTAERRFDSYMFFLESALALLKPGGFCGIVVTSALLRAQAASTLRGLLTDQAEILEVIDFLDQQVFKGASTYVCIVLFRKKAPDSTPKQVMVAKLHSLSATPASQLAQISVASKDVVGGSEVYLASQPVGHTPWIFTNEIEREIQKTLLGISSKKLGDVADIRQGIKTGADPIFEVTAKPSQRNSSLYIINDSTELTIERGALLPLLRNRGLRRWSTQPNSFVIYLYDRKSGKALSWDSIETRFPHAARYLKAHQGKLEGRKSITHGRWWELVRPRCEAVFAKGPQLFTAELSLRPTFCLSTEEPCAILGSTGGGSCLLPTDPSYSISVLMTFLNSPISEWFLRLHTPMRTGGYLLLEQANLSKIPIPDFLTDQDSFLYVEAKRLTDRIVTILATGATKLSSENRREIEEYEKNINVLLFGASKLSATQADYIRAKVSLSRRVSAEKIVSDINTVGYAS